MDECTYIELDGRVRVGDVKLEQLAPFTALRGLSLNYCHIASLENFPKLEELTTLGVRRQMKERLIDLEKKSERERERKKKRGYVCIERLSMTDSALFFLFRLLFLPPLCSYPTT